MQLGPNGVVLKKDNILYYLKLNSEEPRAVNLPNLLIKQFFVTNETLYIYSRENLVKYQLKIN